jgi:DNA-binding IclR family transcriptional regulator
MSLSKAMQILDLLSQPPYEYKISEISENTGINRTTVYRIVKTLARSDYVVFSEGTRKVKVGPVLHHVGSTYLHRFDWGKKVEETLETLANETRESVGFAVREGDKVVSLYEFESHQPFRMNYRPGTLYPMNRGCYGKCLMAFHEDQARVERLLRSQKFEKHLPNTLTEPEEILAEYARIREQGYVLSEGETFSPSAAGVGVPVFTRAGKVCGCLVVAFIKSDDLSERVERYLTVLREHAANLSRCIP